MKRGTVHLAAIIAAVVLLLVGLVLLVGPIVAAFFDIEIEHSTFRDGIGAACLAAAFALALPSNVKEVITLYRPVIQFGRRQSDRDIRIEGDFSPGEKADIDARRRTIGVTRAVVEGKRPDVPHGE